MIARVGKEFDDEQGGCDSLGGDVGREDDRVAFCLVLLGRKLNGDLILSDKLF